jgi:hypothetical protein
MALALGHTKGENGLVPFEREQPRINLVHGLDHDLGMASQGPLGP